MANPTTTIDHIELQGLNLTGITGAQHVTAPETNTDAIPTAAGHVPISHVNLEGERRFKQDIVALAVDQNLTMVEALQLRSQKNDGIGIG